jgi:acetamidase/formamidase
MVDKLGLYMTSGAVCLWLAVTVHGLMEEKKQLEVIKAEQTRVLAAGKTIEKRVNDLANSTAQLALSGNPVAQRVTQILQAQNIQISASPTPPASTPAP